jgi:hypothetical protein
VAFPPDLAGEECTISINYKDGTYGVELLLDDQALFMRLEASELSRPAAPQATGTVTSSDAVRTPKAGDRIHHPEFGAGTLDQLIGDMAFCIFDEVRDSAGHSQRNAKRSPYVCELTPLLGFDEEEF